jgi:hypothetical protein
MKEFRHRIGCSPNWRKFDTCNGTGLFNTGRYEDVLHEPLTEHDQLISLVPMTSFVENVKVLCQSRHSTYVSIKSNLADRRVTLEFAELISLFREATIGVRGSDVPDASGRLRLMRVLRNSIRICRQV